MLGAFCEFEDAPSCSPQQRCCRYQDSASDVSGIDVSITKSHPAKSARCQKQEWTNSDGTLSLPEVLTILWPTVSAFILRFLAAVLIPALREIRPLNVSEDFKIDVFGSSVGEDPPSFKQADKIAGSSSGSSEEMGAIVSFDVLGDTAIFLNASHRSLGIDGISVSGALRIEFSGSGFGKEVASGHAALLSARSLHVFLLDCPQVSIECRNLRVRREQEHVVQAANRAIVNAISRFLVLPNVLSFPLASGTDAFDYGSHAFQGVLQMCLTPKFTERFRPPFSVAKRGSALGFFGGNRRAESDGNRAKELERRLEIRCGSEIGASINLASAFSDPLADNAYSMCFLICYIPQQCVTINIWDGERLHMEVLKIPVLEMISWGASEMMIKLTDGTVQGEEGQTERQFILSASWRPIEPLSSVCHFLEDMSLNRIWLLSISVYGVSGLPRYGEGVLHWIVAECDYVALEDNEMQTSVAVIESSNQIWYKPFRAEQCAEALKEKLSILQEHGFTVASVARALDVDKNLFAEVDAAMDLTANTGLGIQDLHWNHVFHFPITNPRRAELSLKLVRKSFEKPEVVTERYTYQVVNLGRTGNHEIAQAAALKTTGAFLKFRLQLRPLGKPAGCLMPL